MTIRTTAAIGAGVIAATLLATQLLPRDVTALPSCLCLRAVVEVWHADPVFHAAPEGLSFST